MIHGDWFSLPRAGRAAIGWTEDGRRVLADRLTMEWSVLIDGRAFPVAGMNQVRHRSARVLYTPVFGPSTRAGGGGQEVVISQGKVSGIERSGDAPIPPNGYVLSLGSQLTDDLSDMARGSTAELLYRFLPALSPSSDRAWREEIDFVLGGTPLLIKDGVLLDDYSEEQIQTSFVEKKHPRTAVGFLPDGTWVLVVVDGRRPSVSVGMNLEELAQFMQSLGCEQAVNLDGGGSSTLYLYGQVVNLPSDVTGEREVSDAILVLERR
jgi:hypothetical protein